MEEFGRLKLDFFKTFLEMPNGAPDESVFRRVLQCLNPYQLKEGLENWLLDIKLRTKGEEDAARLVNIEGKTMDAGHCVSGRRAPGKNGECGAESEYTAETGAAPVAKNDDGKGGSARNAV
jgi:hypothetical protein